MARMTLDEAYEQWKRDLLSTHIDDVSGQELKKEQAEFLHGGVWLANPEKDHSYAHALEILREKKRTLVATPASLPSEMQEKAKPGLKRLFGFFQQPQEKSPSVGSSPPEPNPSKRRKF